MDIGESLSTLRKHGVKPRKTELTPELIEVARRTQAAYSFHREAWQMLGIRLEDEGKAAKAAKAPAKKRSRPSSKKRRTARKKRG